MGMETLSCLVEIYDFFPNYGKPILTPICETQQVLHNQDLLPPTSQNLVGWLPPGLNSWLFYFFKKLFIFYCCLITIVPISPPLLSPALPTPHLPHSIPAPLIQTFILILSFFHFTHSCFWILNLQDPKTIDLRYNFSKYG